MTDEAGWLRLDQRTLLTGPINVIRGAIVPILVAAFVGGGESGSRLLWALGGLVVAIVVGMVPWLTTTYRVTSTHIEVRRVLLSRTTVTASRDRVRSVDLQASALHRILGITRVVVGTGSDESQVKLDSLSVAEAMRLRTVLLHEAAGRQNEDVPTEAVAPTPAAAELARLDWSWLRFAPLNVGELLVGLAGLAVLGQFVNSVNEDEAVDVWDWLSDQEISGLVAWGVPLLAGLWLVLSLAGFALRWAGLLVTREQGKEGTTLHRTYGLLTKRATTVEESKVRGATVTRPLLVGIAGGGTLSLLTNGLDDNQPHLLPSAPLTEVRRLAADVLDDAAAMEGELVGHGTRTRRRYYVRNLAVAAFVAGVFALWSWWLAGEWWPEAEPPVWAPVVVLAVVVVIAVFTAELRWRRLGHLLTDRYLVSQTGTWTIRRVALESDGIVGWRVHQGIWDRWRGLSQLTATTAAGPEYVVVPDVPLGEAIRVAAQATPRTIEDFLA